MIPLRPSPHPQPLPSHLAGAEDLASLVIRANLLASLLVIRWREVTHANGIPHGAGMMLASQLRTAGGLTAAEALLLIETLAKDLLHPGSQWHGGRAGQLHWAGCLTPKLALERIATLASQLRGPGSQWHGGGDLPDPSLPRHDGNGRRL